MRTIADEEIRDLFDRELLTCPKYGSLKVAKVKYPSKNKGFYLCR